MSPAPVLSSYEIWMSAYATGDAPVDARLVMKLFECIGKHYSLGPGMASFGLEKPRRESDPVAWLGNALERQMSERPNPHRLPRIGMSSVTNRGHSWFLESSTHKQSHHVDRMHDPALFASAELELAKRNDSAIQLLSEATRLFLSDSRIWYGFLDIAPQSHIPFSAFYTGGGCWIDNHRWERLVEQARWHDFAMRDRDRVRGVFWGNILGPEFADRVRKAGYDKLCDWYDDQYGHRPVTITDESTGSMAILLDDDPVAFAKTRDTGQMDLGSMNRSVKTGALVWEVFSKAGLL